ncbi:MAG: hypothetical protein EA369_03640 [Bradymonadales bacterium]|nr:MAG: hypothetical protein EA369_03640 [Bradymonadales bacterium]
MGIEFVLSLLLVSAGAGSPVLVPAPIKNVYIPMGFDDNDITQVVVEGSFESACYRAGPSHVWKDPLQNRIAFHLEAYYYPEGFCAEVMTPYLEVIDIGELSKGVHQIFLRPELQGLELKEVGQMPVAEALSERRDEYLYAPVDSIAIVENSLGRRRDLLVMGTFTNSCMRFNRNIEREKPGFRRVSLTAQNLLEVLPVLHDIEDTTNCRDIEEAFVERLSIPQHIQGDRYLFHIRTMSGKSFNKIDRIDHP